jgi:hypothetical protein
MISAPIFMMKHLSKIIIPLFILVDIVANTCIDREWTGNLKWPINSFALFLLLAVVLNSIMGFIYLKNHAPKWLVFCWVILYVCIMVYFLVRWCFYSIGAIPDTFVYKSHASLGISVFTFGIFYLINYFVKGMYQGK